MGRGFVGVSPRRESVVSVKKSAEPCYVTCPSQRRYLPWVGLARLMHGLPTSIEALGESSK
jgi:hypothetical protein